MASGDGIKETCGEVICSICLKYFTDLLTLEGCGHRFCEACLTKYWLEFDTEASCPQCKGAVFGPTWQQANVSIVKLEEEEKAEEPMACKEEENPIPMGFEVPREQPGHDEFLVDETSQDSKKAEIRAKKKIITIELKKEIIEKHERGVRVTDLALEYMLGKSTISTILKKKEIIKKADVAKGVTILTKKRGPLLEEVEKLLLVWMNEKQLKGASVSEAMICEKAMKLHGDLLARNFSGSVPHKEFKASKGWFEKFQKRSGIHSVSKHGEASGFDQAAAEAYKKDFAEFVKEEGYLPQQVFSCDETGLFWKKMPRRTYLTQEEQRLPGPKPMKDRLTLLLCANASGDLKIMPLLVYHSQTPRAFHRENVNKAALPVMWRANSRGWMTRQLFLEWFYEVFTPTVKKYLSDNQLPEKCLLLMDNAPAHPPFLVDDFDAEYDFIRVAFLPANTTPLLQPMDQQVIRHFKKLYTKALFAACFDITEELSLTLKEFWKSHFNILHCIRLIVKAWRDVPSQILNSAWSKLWPECVTDSGIEVSDAEVVEEIVSMGMNLGLEVQQEDLEELVQDHEEELNTEELMELHAEQQKAVVEELYTEEEEEGEQVSSQEIRAICQKWTECQDFFERHHPNRPVTSRVLDLMNDNVVGHFRKVLQSRMKQVTPDRCFSRIETAAKRPRPQTLGGDDPKEGSSTSQR